MMPSNPLAAKFTSWSDDEEEDPFVSLKSPVLDSAQLRTPSELDVILIFLCFYFFFFFSFFPFFL